MTEPSSDENQSGAYDAEAYDADHDPVDDVPGADSGQEAILGGGYPTVYGQESIGLSQTADEETRNPPSK